jgi:hypothetical protein
MKKILTLYLFIFSIYANAQKDTLGMQLSDSTAIGTPDGKPVSKQIGASGGTIISEDGRMELIFPEGALTVNTAISIQPTANLAPNGVGKSYWLEPSGIQFKKPVQIIFHYTDQEADICPPDWMSLGIQDQKGKWTFIDYESFDSISKTLNGFIHHFSSVSNINDVRLMPHHYVIPVNERTVLEIIDMTLPPTPGYHYTGYELANVDINNPILMYANRVLHGNDHTGKISADEFRGVKLKWITVVYKAPSIMPKENPVTIWAEIYRKTRKGKLLRRRLSTSILVYDMYKISVVHEIKGNEFGIKEFLGGGELIDSASCIVKVYPHEIRISDIQNYEPKITKEPGIEHGGTLKLKIFTAGMQGSIHLTANYSNFRLSGYPPEVFYKLPLRNIAGFRVQYVGRRYTGPVQTLPYPSLPTEIEFIANGREQRYNVTIAGMDSHKLIVTPYR